MNTQTILIDPVMTIDAAASLLSRIDAAMGLSADLTLDLGKVTRMDCTGIALLLASQRNAAARGARLTITGLSQAVRDQVTLSGLRSLLQAEDAGE